MALLVPFALAGLWTVAGEPSRAAIAAGLGLVAVCARLLLGRRFHRGITAIGRGVERGIEAIVGTLMWGALVLPGWAASRRSARGRSRGWRPPSVSARVERPFTESSVGLPPGVRALRGIGVLAVVLTLDLVLGSMASAASAAGSSSRVLLPAVAAGLPGADPRALSPALAGEPWAQAHVQELQRLPLGYWPYTLSRPLDFHGSTVNVDGWVRRSHQTVERGGDVPTIAFFGGSTTFGEGQRDGHTIPSWVARLAAADGLPVRVVNLGQRGWGAWQEALLFEQLTARAEDRPDVAVFYDGSTDLAISAQPETRGSPSHLDLARVRDDISGNRAPVDQGGGSVPADLLDWYVEHSLAASLLGRVAGGDPAGAAEDAPPVAPAPDAEDAYAVYRRARNVILATAGERSIVPWFFWEPIRTPGAAPGYAASVDAPTVDISEVLDRNPEVFLDEVHTNERGARIVAERIWRSLRETVAALARGEHPPIPAPSDSE